MKTTYTLIVGDAHTEPDRVEFIRVDFIRTYPTLEAAEEAGEAAIMGVYDSYVIPEVYTGVITFTVGAQ